MIDLAAPVQTFAGVTVFADHADPKLFHYIPVAPRLASDATGRPDISLLKYHLDPSITSSTGAALFQLTVDLAVDDDDLAALKDKVSVAVGRSGITLAPIWPDSGTARLVLLDASTATAPTTAPTDPTAPPSPVAGLVEDVVGGADPDLPSNGTTMFACTLDPAGSAIIEQALRQGGLPFGVIYDLQVAALRPALRATISADYAATYHFFQDRLHGGRLLLAVDIGEAMQALTQQQAIRVAVDDLVPEADKDGIYQNALDQVQQYILDTLFTPTITAPSADPDPAPSIGSTVGALLGMFTITYSLDTIDSSELKTLTYSLGVAQAEEITLSPQASLTALLPAGLSVDSVIVAVDPAPPDQLSFDIASLVDLGAEAIDHLDVTLSYAGADQVITLTEATQRQTASMWYSAAGGLETAYRYDAQLAADGPKGLTGLLNSASATSVHDLVRIDPRALYQRVDLRPSLQGVPADRFPSVIVDVEASEALDGWTANDTVTLNAASPETALAYRGRPDGLITLRTRTRYVRSTGEELTAGWVDADPGPMVIPDPEPDLVVVQVIGSARFGSVVARLVVELRPDATPDEVTAVDLDAQATAANWSYAPSATARGYSYRVTIQSMAGAVQPGNWLPGPSDPTLVVGEGFSQLRMVKVVFVGTTLSATARIAAKVRLTFDDATANLHQDNEFLVQDPLAPITWAYPVADPARGDYTMTLTWIDSDGSSRADPPRTGSDLLQVVVVTIAAS